MEFKTYGTTGKILIAFPPQDGHAIDEESWSDKYGDEHYRLEQQERWFAYINEEFLPSVRAKNGSPEAYERAMTTGCSMGAVHAANFFFRRPDLYDTVIALSAGRMSSARAPGSSTPSCVRKVFPHGSITGDSTATMTGRGGESSFRISWSMCWDLHIDIHFLLWILFKIHYETHLRRETFTCVRD